MDHKKDNETKEQRALRVAAHALTTMQGLRAFDVQAPQEAFMIDNSNALAVISEALGVSAFADTYIGP